MNPAQRIAVANAVLATFRPEIHFFIDADGLLRLDVTRVGDRILPLARVRDTNAHRFDFPVELWPFDMWTMEAAAHLTLYIEDKPRWPLSMWKFWAGERVRMCKPRTIELLEKSDYGDPAKTNCIFCGAEKFRGGLYWWHLDEEGTLGPCCLSNACVVKPEMSPAVPEEERMIA